ncbi:MAG: acetyl-CoA carboxylase biotin carboxyl carrier protein [Chitinophagales bacterium]|nr:acetyl-CoA carboxylase biotin carboxyl carrier protein [Chitinophagales bacterium]
MNNKEIHELIKLVDKSDLAEFKMKQGDFSVTIRSKDFFKGKAQQMVSVMPSAAAPAPEAAAAASLSAPETKNIESNTANTDTPPSEDYYVFKSPMVGTFYRKPSPDKEVFIKVGDKINQGDVVAIVEAMKLFNEIESEVSGTVVKILMNDQTPVEYDQPLFLIDLA